jgi:DEAD/DEAH box helicase domain-containing protein
VAGYKKIRYYTHENIGYGPVNLPDQEMHTTSSVVAVAAARNSEARFASRQDALDGFLGAAYALHVVAKVAVMADAADLQKAVGSGDGAWFATADGRGAGSCAHDGSAVDVDARPFVRRSTSTTTIPAAWARATAVASPARTRAPPRELVELRCKAGCPACVGPVARTPGSSRRFAARPRAARARQALEAA